MLIYSWGDFRSDIAFAGPFPSGTLTLNARDVEIAPSANLVFENAIAGTMESLTFKAGKTSLGDATQPTLTIGNLAARNAFVAKQVTFDGIDVTMSANGYFLPQKGSLRLVNHASCKTSYGYSEGDINKVVSMQATCLSITGTAARLETGHIRFLNAGLTEAQLKPMRYNGRQRIAMDADGWLTSYTPGLVVIVK